MRAKIKENKNPSIWIVLESQVESNSSSQFNSVNIDVDTFLIEACLPSIN